MRTFVKSLALVLALILTVGMISACGNKGSGIADPKPDADGNVVLLIGGVGPLTGDYANYGLSVKNGSQLAVDEINAAGGVNGMTLKLDFQDSGADPKAAVSAYGNLIDKGMVLSLGGTLSGETSSIVAEAKEDKILILTPSGSAKAAIEGNDCAFRLCFNDPQQGTASADYIADNQLATKVAVFYQSDLDYSVGLFDTFKAEAAVKNLEIVTEQTFTKDSATDFSTQIAAIKAADPDLVFIPLYAAEAALLLKQVKTAGGLEEVTFFGCDGLDGITTKGVTNEDVEGVMMLTPFAADSTDAKVQTFVAAYKTKYGSDPDQFAADGYDAVYTFKAVLEKANLSKDDTTDFAKRTVEAMTQIEVNGVTGKMTWTADGENNKNAMALVFKDGVAVAFNK